MNNSREYLGYDIISFLHDRVGDSYKQIGTKIGVSESYICLVANHKRSLTLERLLKLERAYGIPFPLLIAVSMKDEHIPEELREWYKSFKLVLDFFYKKREIFESIS